MQPETCVCDHSQFGSLRTLAKATCLTLGVPVDMKHLLRLSNLWLPNDFEEDWAYGEAVFRTPGNEYFGLT